MDLHDVQRRLQDEGLYGGAIDGLMGPKAMAGMMCSAAGARSPTAVMTAMAPAIVAILPVAALTTPLRICHFLGQATEETDYWKTLVEYGGPTYCAIYDGRKDLGNTEPGDGYRYRGRGPFQLTGRADYELIGRLLGLDLVTYPDKVLDPDIGAATAAAYWNHDNVNQWADVDNLARVTRLVNGGTNGLPARTETLRRLKALWGLI